MIKKRKNSKYIFTLKNIDLEKVDKKFGIITKKENKVFELLQPNNTTNLLDLTEMDRKETVSFLDESKKLYTCNVSIIDFKSNKDINDDIFKKYSCYWCRHPFTNQPVGCPIEYVSNKLTKSYFSEISKDIYTINENITKNKLLKFNNSLTNKNIPFIFTIIKEKKKSNYEINKKDFYLSDGIFCSFNCCKSFIKDNKHDRLYEQSDILLNKLFNEINVIKNLEINPAPHWRLLNEYGGYLTINKFRENFSKISYDFHGIFKSCGYLFEEKINFS